MSLYHQVVAWSLNKNTAAHCSALKKCLVFVYESMLVFSVLYYNHVEQCIIIKCFLTSLPLAAGHFATTLRMPLAVSGLQQRPSCSWLIAWGGITPELN